MRKGTCCKNSTILNSAFLEMNFLKVFLWVCWIENLILGCTKTTPAADSDEQCVKMTFPFQCLSSKFKPLIYCHHTGQKYSICRHITERCESTMRESKRWQSAVVMTNGAGNPTGLSLRWRHNGCDSVSNHQPHDCLLLFRRRSKKDQSSASLAFVWGIHRGLVNSPHKWPVTRKMFPFDDVIMIGSCILWKGLFEVFRKQAQNVHYRHIESEPTGVE